MNVYVIEPCGYGVDFEDCHIVAANSKQEALALLNIKEKDLEKISCDYFSKDWFKGTVNVWRLEGVEVASFVPFEIERNIIGDKDEELEEPNEKVEQDLRDYLKKSERVCQMCKDDAERRPTSAGLELMAISKHVAEKQKDAIRKLIKG